MLILFFSSTIIYSAKLSSFNTHRTILYPTVPTIHFYSTNRLYKVCAFTIKPDEHILTLYIKINV